MVTIDNFFNQLESLLLNTIVPKDAEDESLFMSMEWESNAYWFKIGLPEEWFEPSEYDDYDEDEPEPYPYTHPIRDVPDYSKVKVRI